ncbi:hypothetical protein Tco_1545471 [Tanacetum coccineum]
MAFVSTPGNTNKDTANIQVCTASTPVSTVSTNDTAACLSDAIVYAFLANQPSGSQIVDEDLEQLHDDDLEEMNLKWQLALLSMRARKFYQRTRKKITINGSDTAGFDKIRVHVFLCFRLLLAGIAWIYRRKAGVLRSLFFKSGSVNFNTDFYSAIVVN